MKRLVSIVPLTTAQAIPFDPAEFRLLEYGPDDIAGSRLRVLELNPSQQGILMGKLRARITNNNLVSLVLGETSNNVPTANRVYQTIPTSATHGASGHAGLRSLGTTFSGTFDVYSVINVLGNAGTAVYLTGLTNATTFEVKFYYRLAPIPELPSIPE